jgi:hypothetical protein
MLGQLVEKALDIVANKEKFSELKGICPLC